MESGRAIKIPMQLSRNSVVASIQVDLSHEVLQTFRQDLLVLLQSSGARAVILDVSGVEIMDVEDFDAIRHTMSMASVMGARPIIAGLRPGVVSSLVQLGADVDDVEAALNLDEAFRLLDSSTSADELVSDLEEVDDQESTEEDVDDAEASLDSGE